MSLKYLSCPSKILADSITASSTSFKLNNIKGWNGADLSAANFGSIGYGVIRNANNTMSKNPFFIIILNKFAKK